MITIALSRALLLAATLISGGSDGRITVAEIQLTGPFEGATLEVPGQGDTRIEGHLLAGEVRIVRVPVPARKSPRSLEPRIALDLDSGGLESERGSLRFLGWRGADSKELDLLPAGLRARPRPALGGSASMPGTPALALLAAGFIVGLALRRRPMLALAVGAALATLMCWLDPRASAATPTHIALEEGDSGSSRWLEIEAFRGRMRIAGEPDSVWIESAPEDARIECRVTLESGARWEIAAPRAMIYRLSSFEPGQQSLTRESNRWAELEETWVREDGSWSPRGEWGLGAALPHAISDALPHGISRAIDAAPPGWLAAGLPQGTDILLGRFRARPGEGLAYIRMSGF